MSQRPITVHDASSYVQIYTYYIHINGAYRKDDQPTTAHSAPPSGQVDLPLQGSW